MSVNNDDQMSQRVILEVSTMMIRCHNLMCDPGSVNNDDQMSQRVIL